jgi:outer membrane protein OmpA-like peptidoglycan-associated protein
MEDHMTYIRDRMTRALLAGSLVWVAFGTPTLAGDLSQQQILDKLVPHAPQILTRSLTMPAPELASAQTGSDHETLIETLRHRGNRSLTLQEREEIAAMAQERPAVDLQIYFDFNSAAISPKAVPQLTNLGNALTQSELKDSLVTINGHTDGKGSDIYNRQLSERRAETIKRYLVDHFQLTAKNLVTVGYGKQKLKDATNPLAPENRRVEVVNLASQVQAQY